MSDGGKEKAEAPLSLERSISPPPLRRRSTKGLPHEERALPSRAAVEAGEAEVRDHLEYFAKHLGEMLRTEPGPVITIENFRRLYQQNQHPHGHHFVVHQHDHPISGVHYDLRLQFSATSSISFAVPYGLPGNPNSTRPNRMAIETRVHNFWNHLIESASHRTGSLLVWDTGEYDVLEKYERRARETEDEGSEDEADFDSRVSQSERLFYAFQSRHIRLRLNGSRLPPGYTVSLRLPSANDKTSQPRKPKLKRRRVDPAKIAALEEAMAQFTDSDDGIESNTNEILPVYDPDADAAVASEDEGEEAAIRQNNAYPGATNTIGSIHQRHWFLTLDRKGSGFYKAREGPDEGRWLGPWEPFYVRGRDHERSVVTGRMADDVLEDEGVEKFVGRKLWRPILE